MNNPLTRIFSVNDSMDASIENALRAAYVLFRPVAAVSSMELHGFVARVATACPSVCPLQDQARAARRTHDLHRKALQQCVELVRRGRVPNDARVFVPASLASLNTTVRKSFLECANHLVLCLPPEDWSAPHPLDRSCLRALKEAGAKTALMSYSLNPGLSGIDPQDVSYVLLSPALTRGVHRRVGMRAALLRLLRRCDSNQTRTIATDVDDEDDLAWLAEAGCDHASGPVIGREGPAFPPVRRAPGSSTGLDLNRIAARIEARLA